MSNGGFGSVDALRDAATAYLLAGWRDNDVARVRQLVSSDYRYDLVGREDEVSVDWYLGFLKMAHDAVQGLDVEICDTVVEGDDVAVHLLLKGTQQKKLFGVASRGASGALDVMTRLEFTAGKVSRQSTITDFSALQDLLKG